MVAESTNLTPEDKEITKKIVEVFPNETMYIAEASLNNSVLRNDFLKNYEEMTEEIHRKSGELLALFQQRKENETAQKITLDDIQKQTTEMYDVDLLVEKIFQKNIPDLLAIIEK
jgi:aspartate/tyrosine/aromatic aminotransferase